MAERIRRCQLLNNQIFGVLNNHLQTLSENGELGEDHIREFAPPVHHSLNQKFLSRD